MHKKRSHLHHEDLDVYQIAIDFIAESHSLLAAWPRGYGELKEQLRRASTSIVLNIAEGYGRRRTEDRRRFYNIARGSAHECGAIIDVARVLGFLGIEEAGNAKILLVRIVSMLIRLGEV